MPKFSKIRYFEGGNGVVETRDGRITSSFDASSLYNVKPAYVAIPFTKDDNSPTVTWDENIATFTHALNCYPQVHVFTDEGYEIHPEVRVASATEVMLDFDEFFGEFGMGLELNSNAPWTCVLCYGGEYGNLSNNPNVGNVSSLATELETIRQFFATNGGSIGVQTLPTLIGVEDPTVLTEGVVGQRYVNALTRSVFTCKAIEDDDGTTHYVWDREMFGSDDISDKVRGILPNVIEIPYMTWEYYLHDASYAPNGHCSNYKHFPFYATCYYLPEVTDNTTVHEINLEVDYEPFYLNASESGNDYVAWTRKGDNMTVYTSAQSLEVFDNVYQDATLEVAINEILDIDVNFQYISLNLPHVFVEPTDESGEPGFREVRPSDEVKPAVTVEIKVGDLVNYVFRWSNIRQRWTVMPVIMAREEEENSNNAGVLS